jgi:putative transposase
VRKSKFTEDQIAFALKQNELGISVDEVCRKMGISESLFYIWKKKYSGIGPSELRRLRQLEEENRKLKQIVADLSTRQGDAAGFCNRPSLARWSLSGISCVRHSMTTRSIYAEQDEDEECRDSGQVGGAAVDPEGAD